MSQNPSVPAATAARAFDAVSEIAKQNAGRDVRVLPRKYRDMAASTFAFFRATAHLFYHHALAGGLPASPVAWICGDMHVENFGVYRGNNRLEYFDINDFDESCLGPLAADITRLAASIILASEAIGLAALTQDSLALTALEAYFSALKDGKARWCEHKTSTGAIKALFKQIKSRKRKAFLNSRSIAVKNLRKLAVDGERYLPLNRDDEKPAAIVKIFAALPAPAPHYYDFRDMAFRVAGLGSLGLRRYAVLMHGRGDPDRNALFDVKATAPSAAAQLMPQRQPKWPTEAARIVTLQTRLQAVSAAKLHAARISRRDYVVRALQPSEDRLNLSVLVKNREKHIESLAESFAQMGKMAAWAHLRGAAREGADGPDVMIRFAAKADASLWLNSAKALKSANDVDYIAFKQAYAATDPRLTGTLRR